MRMTPVLAGSLVDPYIEIYMVGLHDRNQHDALHRGHPAVHCFKVASAYII